MKKFLLIFFVAAFISACASNSKVDYETFANYNKIYFKFNQSEITDASKEVLNNQAEFLKKSNLSIIVEGYTDSRGTDDYNMKLGEERANVVKNYLVEQGVPADKIEIVSYGKSKVLSEDNFYENRTAITVIKK